MAFIPLPRGIKITFVFTLFGQEVTVTLHVQAPENVTPTILQQAGVAAINLWETSMRNTMSNDVTLQKVVLTDVSVQDGAQRIQLPGTLVTGSITSPAMSSNVAAVVSLRTARIGRSYRGRIYIPGIPESLVTSNGLDTSLRSALSSLGAAVNSVFTAAGFQTVIASYYNNGAVRTTGHAEPVTSYQVPTTVKTQRRRLP